MTAPFFEALVRASERGVAVRFLFDHLGSRGHPRLQGDARPARRRRDRVATDAADRSRCKGRCVARTCATTARSWWSTARRVHRLAEPDRAGYNKPKNQKVGREWVELDGSRRGPVVPELNVVFATDWYSETDEILADELQPHGPSRRRLDGAVTWRARWCRAARAS